ncbi:MAG: bifunctional DNA-formamidopyrimidine glycosylase/DNA-(apurinic or apyrimidinic site) lyase [Lysobacterales bacterium]
MPELPEVETTLRGIRPHLLGRTIHRVAVREPRLRWVVDQAVCQAEGKIAERLERRGKYLLIGFDTGGLLIHLGMSGSLRVLPGPRAPLKHDHFDLEMDTGVCLRFNDPRRFGALLWTEGDMHAHPLLRNLGPEPLSSDFSGDYMYQRSRGRRRAVKNFIMDGRVVVGVGNIYASEALFMAGIHPSRASGRISKQRYAGLGDAIRDVLEAAIRQGGTTLRDFVASDGTPGYFAQELLVYGRAGQPCFQCGREIRQKVIGQRSSFYCPACQR